MTTRFYLRSTTDNSTGLPTVEKSQAGSDKNAESQSINHTMGTVKGTSQVQLRLSSNPVSSWQNYYFTRFVSEALDETSISSQTWTFNFAARESSLNANFPVVGTDTTNIVLYVWRPSNQTKVGTIRDTFTVNTIAEGSSSNKEYSHHVTFPGSSVSGMQPGDRLVFEVWFTIKQAASTSYNDDFFYNGATITTSNNSIVSNHASFIETTQTLDFQAGATTPVTNTSVHKYNINIIPGNVQVGQVSTHKYRILPTLAPPPDGFTIFLRVFIPYINNETLYQKKAVLFSKLDDEQVTFGYICYVADDGTLQFIVRDNSREYILTAPEALDIVRPGEPDFIESDFNSVDYFTSIILEELLPDPIIYDDLAFTYNFTTHRMQIIDNGIIIADSDNQPELTGLVGHWRMNEGGDIGNNADEPDVFFRTVYNSVETGNNGTIAVGPIWSSDIKAYETYLRFNSASAQAQTVTIPNYADIQTFTALTVSLWYHPISNPAGSDIVSLISKNYDNNGTFRLSQNASDIFESYLKNDSGTSETIASSSGAVTELDKWYHLVLRWSADNTLKISVDDVLTESSGTLSGTVSTGTTALTIGSTTATAEPNGYIHDIKIWNRELSDLEVTTLYEQGHPVTGFPKWTANPPPAPEVPLPITNPFKIEYNLAKPASNWAWQKLHKMVASGFTSVYTKPVGTTIPAEVIPFTPVYEVTDASGGLSGTGGGGGGTPATVYNQVVGSSPQHLEFEDGVSRAGIRFNSGNPHLGKIVTQVKVQFRKQNSPGGSASVVIRKGTDNTVARSLGIFSPGSFGSGEQTAIVTDSANTYVMATNDVVSVEYPSGSNTIELTEIDPSGPSDVSGFTSVVSTGGSFTNNSRVLCMVIDAAPPAPGGGGGSGGTGYPLFFASGYSGGTDCNFGNWTDNDISHIGARITSSSAQMHSKKLSRITVKLSKVGSPPGSVSITLRSSDVHSTIQTNMGVISGSSITTTPTDFTVTATGNTYTMATNSSVVLAPTSSGGNESNYFVAHVSATSQVAGVQVRYRIHNPDSLCFPSGNVFVLKDNTAQDITGKFETGGTTTPAKPHFYSLDGGALRAVGEKIINSSSVIYNKKITRVKPRLKAVGNPVGTIRCVIRNSSGTEVSACGSIEANTVGPTDFLEYEFTNLLQSRNLAVGDKVMIEYNGTSTNHIQVGVIPDEQQLGLGNEQLQTFSGSSYTDITSDMSGEIMTGGTATDPTARERIGEKADLVASILNMKKISRVLVWLRKVGNPSPTSKVFIRVRKQQDDSTQANIGEVLVSSITTNAAGAQYTFINSPVSIYALQLDDSLLVEYADGDDTNYIELAVATTDAIDTNKSILVKYDSLFTNYDNVTTNDLIATMSSGGDTFTPTGDEIPPPPPPAYTHDLHLFAGGYPYDYYDTDISNPIENWVSAIAPDIRFYRKVLTITELTNIYINRKDRSNLPFGQIAVVGFFSLPPS